MYRVNRYRRGQRWFWRLWRGDVPIARCARSYDDSDAMERDLRSLFPHWVKR
jgi:hypothetical protein